MPEIYDFFGGGGRLKYALRNRMQVLSRLFLWLSVVQKINQDDFNRLLGTCFQAFMYSNH